MGYKSTWDWLVYKWSIEWDKRKIQQRWGQKEQSTEEWDKQG